MLPMTTLAGQGDTLRDDAGTVRRYYYTHSQPQWSEVMGRPGAPPAASDIPPVMRAPPLPPSHRCTSCQLPKQSCTCGECAVCVSVVGRGSRHHCRKCWRPVCSSCWLKFRYVHMLGRPMRVCDRCAVPWGLANLCKREERGMYWGLYLLRRAGEMPSMCVAPKCHTFTYYKSCYVCGTATVNTQPHFERLVRVDASRIDDVDKVRILDATAHSVRFAAVDAMPPEEVHQTFRRCFHHCEEALAFRGVLSTLEAQDILLGMIAATVSYEYDNGPNITLAFSDVPYARLLKIVSAKPRYTVFEAPGRVKFVAFPGTHNWRTRWADLKFSSEQKQVWTPLVEGIRIDPDTGAAIPLCGGVRKVWDYKVHAGFAQEARDVGLPMGALIEDIRCGYRLVFAGHSLGGAVAQLLTVQMLARYPTELTLPDVNDYRVRPPGDPLPWDVNAGQRTGKILCVTLGAPLVGNYQFVERVEGSGWAGRFHNFVYRTDFVPRMSCADELAWDATSQVVQSVSSFYQSLQSKLPWMGRSTSAAAAAVASTINAGGCGSGSNSARTNEADNGSAGEDRRGNGDPLAAMGYALARGAGSFAAAGSHGDDRDGGWAPEPVHFSVASTSTAGAHAPLERLVGSAIRRGRDALGDATAAVAGIAGDMQAAAAAGAFPNASQSEQYSSTEEESVTMDVSDIIEQINNAEETSAHKRLHRRFTCVGRFHFLAFGRYGYVSSADSELAFQLLKRGCGEDTVLRDHSVASYNRGVMLHLYGKK